MKKKENEMEPQELIDFLKVAGVLKKNTRHCFISEDRKESIADHSYRITLMAMLISNEEEFRQLDMNRVIRMCLIHDIGEAFTGDIPAFIKTDGDEKTEDMLFDSFVDSLPAGTREEFKSLLSEMRELKTMEAKTYKALDKLEAVISHNESDLSTWLPLEYDLQFSYCNDYVEFSDYFVRLKNKLDEWTKNKIENGN